MTQGASSQIDMNLNIGMGLILATAEVAFASIIVYLYGIGKYFFSILFLLTSGPLIITSIMASNLQLLDAQSKTQYQATVNDAGYKTLLQMQRNYQEQIQAIKNHPFYNEQNPVNKKRFDEQIANIMAKQEQVNYSIANYNPNVSESGKGFEIMATWFNLSTDQFKQDVFFSISVLLELVMLLSAMFLTIDTAPNGSGTTPRPRHKKPFWRNLFSKFKLPSIVSTGENIPPPRGANALNTSEITANSAQNIPEYSTPKGDHPLNIQFGNYINNPSKPLVANLGSFPHLIVAGGSGSGKSTLIKAIVTQIIANDPNKVKFIPIDLKQGATLFRFKNVPNLEKPLAADNKTAMQYLDWLVVEVKRRQDFLTQHECEDVIEYSEEYGKMPFHYLVGIFEEIALLMQEDKKVADKLSVLTATGRSAGVHAILCTQYPKAEILPTKITANCLGRICFAMDKESQSRVVLDEPGAEKLQGQGHAIFKHKRHLLEIQTPLYSKTEIQSVVNKAIQEYGRNIPQSNIIPFPKNIPLQSTPDENIPISDGNIPDENIPDGGNISKIEFVKKLYQEGKRQVEIAQILGVPQGTVSKLLKKHA